ncbi:MAG: fumarylacetoacetate hydrolase family protein [Myxococcota bacterium]|jgi:2-oxopent-4-enoate/cis-2-oxohex-4-enoate hydratase|nr:fumarylacetoacetate hydrolase family protein [Myxococcota bacterium]
MVDHAALGRSLYEAMRRHAPVEPLRGRVEGLTIEHAYRVSRAMLECRLADGEKVIGKKIGVTSPAVQDMLGVHQPDFGYLTDAMRCEEVMPISTALIQPRAEGEIAFTLSRDLVGPGVTPEDVLAATGSVHACFEVVDSRIRDWRIGIEDTVADNASSGMFVLGPGVDPGGVDFEGCRMVVTKNGQFLSEGKGSAALGSPLVCVAWLANTMGGFGVPLVAGEVILSGSLVPLEPVKAGDHMHVSIEGIGETEVRFT